MFSNLLQWLKNCEHVGRTMILTGTQDSNRTSRNNEQKEAKHIEIDGRENICSVAFLADGKHLLSGDRQGKVRRWRVENGREVGTPMDAGGPILSITVSQDEKWE